MVTPNVNADGNRWRFLDLLNRGFTPQADDYHKSDCCQQRKLDRSRSSDVSHPELAVILGFIGQDVDFPVPKLIATSMQPIRHNLSN
jgi:hypothetical protein